MRLITVLALLSITTFTNAADIVRFDSDEGATRFERAEEKADFSLLANYFEPQINSMFCGAASATIVLNSLTEDVQQARGDSKLFAADGLFVPKGFVHPPTRYSQENIFIDGTKTHAQVLGEPMLINGELIKDYGFQLAQLANLFVIHQQPVKKVVVDEGINIDEVRADLIENLGREGDFIVINYQRKALGQKGGGHISPLAAYDHASDSFLILDVNPAAQPWVWVEASDLVKSMQTFDTVENRGYLHIGISQNSE